MTSKTQIMDAYTISSFFDFFAQLCHRTTHRVSLRSKRRQQAVCLCMNSASPASQTLKCGNDIDESSLSTMPVALEESPFAHLKTLQTSLQQHRLQNKN